MIPYKSSSSSNSSSNNSLFSTSLYCITHTLHHRYLSSLYPSFSADSTNTVNYTDFASATNDHCNQHTVAPLSTPTADWSDTSRQMITNDRVSGSLISSEQNRTEPILQDLLLTHVATSNTSQLPHCISQPKMMYSQQEEGPNGSVELKQPKLEPSVLQLHQLVSHSQTLASTASLSSQASSPTLNSSCSQISLDNNTPSPTIINPMSASLIDDTQV